jgi:hypothetical protein
VVRLVLRGLNLKQIIELNIPNTLKNQGVKGIFYEGRTICVSYKGGLLTFKIHKEDQSRTLERFDKLVRDSIDRQIKNEIKLCIAANWELILTSKTEVPLPELDREALELNQREHLDRLDKLCRFKKDNKPNSECAAPSKSYSRVFSTYVTIEENKTRSDQ